MIGNLQGWHLIIILAIVLLLFGAPKLPALARSVGQSMRIFKGEVKELQKDDKTVTDDKASSSDSVDAGIAKVDENVTEIKHKG